MSISSEMEQTEVSFDIIGSLTERIPQQENVPHDECDDAGGSPLVQTLYEGPRKCGCCINWVDYLPLDADDPSQDVEDELPLVLRHSVTRGEDTSRVSLHSIEVRDPAARAVLFPVFQGLDGLNPSINYLVFHAPFKPFFYRWAEFCDAVDSCAAPGTKAILEKLRDVVKAQLAEAFAIRDELVSNGVISYPYLWTIFQPGEIICGDDGPAGGRRFYYLEELSAWSFPRQETEVFAQHVEYSFGGFGLVESNFFIPHFQGTRPITELVVYPARFVPDSAAARQAAVSRGRKFAALAGVHCKEYGDGSGQCRRVVVDSQGNPMTIRPATQSLRPESRMTRHTGDITQVPPDAPPVGGHVSLGVSRWDDRSPTGRDDCGGEFSPVRRRGRDFSPVEPRRRPRSPPRRRPLPPMPPARFAPQDYTSRGGESEEGPELDEFHLQLCTNIIEGFCLKNRRWRTYKMGPQPNLMASHIF